MRRFRPFRRQLSVILAAVVLVALALARLGAGGDTAFGQSPTATPGAPQFQLEIDTVQDGSTFCEPVSATSTEALGSSYRVAVCVKDPPAAIGFFQFDLVYDDTLNTAPEIPDVWLALDDNPDANAGATTWPNSTTGDDLGDNWDCTGFGIQYPKADIDPLSGPGDGRAKIVCYSILGPWTLGDDETEGVLATVQFNVIGLGADTLHLENVGVADTMGYEMGSCNPGVAVPIPCLDATESKVTPTPTPAPGTPTPTPAPGNSITSPDTGGDVGYDTSLALDASGNPVVSYLDLTNGRLKVLHCGNADCTSGNSIASLATFIPEMLPTSLALDASGFPVVSYYGSANDLVVLHCGDADCTSGNSITSPDTAGDVGRYSSLALDASGNPVVSYWYRTTSDLRVLHCNDPNCSGGDESITSPDTEGEVGGATSLALDASGNPVVSYYDAGNDRLKLLHCNDPNCAGGDESIVLLLPMGPLGGTTSLALDGSGNPVVSYYDSNSNDLMVMHCVDPNCSSTDPITGEPQLSIVWADTEGDVGSYSHLALDGSGNPVVSYYDGTNGDLKVLHCGDADCTYGNIITSVDTADNVGAYTSLALDAQGNFVVSYLDSTNGDLKVYHGCPTVDHVAGKYDDPGWDPEDDGHEALDAQLDDPHGLYETGTGDSLYFADTGNDRIRKIDGDGIITTVVGGGDPTPGFCGDGDDATSACLDSPRDVFLDEDGNIYLADTDNHRIRVVNTQAEDDIVVAGVTIHAGDIETVAGGGNPTPGFCGDGDDATSACLDTPSGVAVDEAGNIYIADTENNRIRKVDASTGNITTIVGDGTQDYGGDGGPATDAYLNGPRDVYPYGSMYAGTTDLLIADTDNNVIRWVHGPSGIINTLAGDGDEGFDGDDGPAIQAKLHAPEAVAADTSLAVFIADTQNDRIRQFAFGEAVITTFAGGGDGCEANDDPPYYGCPATDAELNKPKGVAVGSLTYSDSGSATIGQVDPSTGKPITSFSNAAACSPGMATIDWAFVLLTLGLIFARRRIGAPLMRIQTRAGLSFRPKRKGRA